MLKYFAPALIALFLVSGPANANELPNNCGSSAGFYNAMKDVGMYRVTVGKEKNFYVEQWANEITGYWAILITYVEDGVSCIVGGGDNFQYVGPPAT